MQQKFTEEFEVSSGVKSVALFNLVMESAIRQLDITECKMNKSKQIMGYAGDINDNAKYKILEWVLCGI